MTSGASNTPLYSRPVATSPSTVLSEEGREGDGAAGDVHVGDYVMTPIGRNCLCAVLFSAERAAS